MEAITEKIRDAAARDAIEVRFHARKRMAQRNIFYSDICQVISNGVVVEEYPKAYPYPGCLLMDFISGEPLYAVCSWDGEKAYLITVHWLDPHKWIDPCKRRK